jgi:SAM-dependent methyltransferase
MKDGSVIYDMGCGDGTMTAAMAALNPYLTFIGVDRNHGNVKAANDLYKFDNISFIQGDVTDLSNIPDDSADAVINSRILGVVYTRTGYSADKVQDAIESQFRILKKNGIYLLYDYIMKPEDEYVLMEFPVMKGSGFKTRADMRGKDIKYQGERDCDSLLWYSKNARPSDAMDDNFRGFFIEELPAKRPFTRLFRLPHKWAYEFTLRMDNTDVRIDAARSEFSCLTIDDYIRVMERNYARIRYTRPWRNPITTRDIFQKRFRMFWDDDKMSSMPFPDTGFLMVAQKTESGRSLKISERRSEAFAENVIVNTVKDEATGDMFDLAARTGHQLTIIPFRYEDQTGRLKIAMRKDVPFALTNTVIRRGHNIDRRRWSGHGLEALTLSVDALEGQTPTKVMHDHFGMRVPVGCDFLEGPKGFPAPDLIENYIETVYVELSPDQPIWEKHYSLIDVERLLRAINAGYIPDAWLEVQIEMLMRHFGIERDPWMHEELPIGDTPPPEDMILDVEKIFNWDPDAAEKQILNFEKKKAEKSDRFRPVKGKAGQLKTKRSLFVGEGQKESGKTGIVSSEHDFVMSQDGIINRAAVMFLTADLKGETLVGFDYEEMPAPYRLGVKDKMINLPTMDLPKDIRNIDEAKEFLAKKFDTSVDRIGQVGESFLTMKDMMPQRTYLFAVGSAPNEWMGKRKKKWCKTSKLWKLEPDYKWSMLFTYGMLNVYQGQKVTDMNRNHDPRIKRESKKFGTLKSVGLRDSKSVDMQSHKGWIKSKNQNDNGSVVQGILRPYSPPKKTHG